MINPIFLRKLTEKDVVHGYGLVLPLSKIDRIPGVLLAPMNIMTQNTIDEHGRIVENDRLTHDQNYKCGSGTLVNIRVYKENLLPCRFGACLKRLINWTVTARKKFPGKTILFSKMYYKLAYRRCHLNADTEIQAWTQIPEEDLAIVALRLTFGGAPGPYEWLVLSDYICDFSIAIMQDAGWDTNLLCATNIHIVPPPLFMGDFIPFAEVQDLIIDVPVDARGTADVYTDGTIALTVDVEDSNSVQQIEQATILTINCAAREIHNDEPIPREEIAARAKLLAEAGAEEIKIFLGWILNFRTFTIALPKNKYVAWKVAILEILDTELEQMIGRLVHLGIVLPSINHFMSRSA